MNSYLVFHSLAELFSVIIAWSMLMVAWNTRRYLEHSYFLFLGAGYAAVGFIDLVHTLAFKGMGVFPGATANLPTQLWIAARYLNAGTLLLAPLLLKRKARTYQILVFFILFGAVLLTSIFSGRFPDCFIEGQGLTRFKVISEYGICLGVAAAMGILWQRRNHFHIFVVRLLMASMAALIFEELSFTLYSDVYGFFNSLGHILKIISFWLLYRAIIVMGLQNPYQSLFRDLSQSKERYQTLFDTMIEGFALHEIITDAKGIPTDYRFLEINPAFERLTGLCRADLIGRRAKEILPGLEPYWIESFGRVALTGEPVRMENYSCELGRWYDVLAYQTEPGRFAVIFTDTTHQRQIQEIRKRESQILSQVHDAVIVTDMEGKVTRWNKGAENLYGYTEEEIIGQHVSILYFKEDLPQVLDHTLYQLKAKGNHEMEERCRTWDGKEIRVHLSLSLLLDERGKPYGLISYSIDITERTKALAEAEKAMLLLDALMACVPEGIAVAEALGGRILRVSRMGAALTGKQSEELENIPVEEYSEKFAIFLSDGRTPAPVETLPLMRALKNGEIVKDEIFCVHNPEGQVTPVLCNAVPITVRDGLITGGIVSWQDISALKKAEAEIIKLNQGLEEMVERRTAELLVSKGKYYRLFSEMLNGFALHEMLYDTSGRPEDCRFMEVNPAFEAMTGLKAMDIIGRTVKEVFPHTTDIWINTFGRVALTREPAQFDLYSELFSKWFHISAFSPEPKQFAALFEDITSRVKAEKEREAIQSQLFQAQKMESLGTLAGGIAHDFNNILTSIIGFCELSMDEIKKGSWLDDNFTEILKAGNRAKDLVRQILTFARKSEEKSGPVRVDRIVKEVLDFIRSTLPSSIEIRSAVKSRSMVMSDATQLHQVVMNLCTNAAHAMEDNGGILEVGVEDITVNGTASTAIIPLKPGKYIEIRVSDTGCGIEPDMIKNIFVPYFTTRDQGQGTGIGLAVVHRIVENHGGSIMVESTPGKGSCFHVCLPMIAGLDEKNTQESAPLPGGTETLLIVDDEPSITKFGKKFFKGLGYTVFTSESSRDALEMFRADPGGFDLIITDMTMPKMTGDLLAGEIFTIRPDIPIILCSGFHKKLSGSMDLPGIKALIKKPLDKAELAGTVRRVLDELKNPDEIFKDG